MYKGESPAVTQTTEDARFWSSHILNVKCLHCLDNSVPARECFLLSAWPNWPLKAPYKEQDFIFPSVLLKRHTDHPDALASICFCSISLWPSSHFSLLLSWFGCNQLGMSEKEQTSALLVMYAWRNSALPCTGEWDVREWDEKQI